VFLAFITRLGVILGVGLVFALYVIFNFFSFIGFVGMRLPLSCLRYRASLGQQKVGFGARWQAISLFL
jgi:hypothetical protein